MKQCIYTGRSGSSVFTVTGSYPNKRDIQHERKALMPYANNENPDQAAHVPSVIRLL